MCGLLVSLLSAVRRPVHDKRAYRYVLLSNGTKVLLVSDPDGDEAAASVAVGVGSFADPADLQGLAHFTEHMLFQGSRKFSTNTGFFDFIHDKGGRANAYTSHTFTVMSFAVPARHLAEALERVADIFANPTLDPRDATQEVKAVHEEFAIRLSDDSVRLAHLARQVGSACLCLVRNWQREAFGRGGESRLRLGCVRLHRVVCAFPSLISRLDPSKVSSKNPA